MENLKLMKREILNVDELSAALETLDGWSVDGNTLKKRLKFDNFAAALECVNRVGALAEAANHHPDITFGWGYANIALTTHDRGGITDVDLALARQINGIRPT
ncbi:4a-hydroxytetrahydrobiopterin dehydratase [soil metagenome]